MAIDTVQKRMSSISLGLPFRGPLVDASEIGFNQGNRQASIYYYSGIDAGVPPSGAFDTPQKRMSAMNPASPWRGSLVDATETGFNQGNRQAADYHYSGSLAISIEEDRSIIDRGNLRGIGSGVFSGNF